jgi:hypothetical protein
MLPSNAVKIYRELAARPHMRAEDLAFNDIHQEVLNTPVKTTRKEAQSTARSDKCKCCGEAIATNIPTARRIQTRAVKRCIQERYFLNASKSRLPSGKFQSTQHGAL